MSVVKNIESFKNELSGNDLKLAEYILNNIEEIPTMTSTILGTRSQTSAAAVVRFSKKMGFSRYSDFKLSVSKDIENRIYSGYSNVSIEDPFQTAKNKLLRNDKMVIDATGDILDEKAIETVISVLMDSQKIYVYGIGSSALAAEDIRQKWTRLGKTVIFDKDKYILSQQMVNDRESSIFFGISNSGKNKEVLSLVDEAKSLNILTVGLAQIGQNDLSKKVDVVLQTAKTEEMENYRYGSGATHSILVQLVTIDILFHFYLRKLSLIKK